MSEYPPPNKNDIFNPIDYETNDDETNNNENSSSNNDSFDHSNLISKTGDTMTGSLIVPNIVFPTDSSSQTTAFTSEIKQSISTAIVDIADNSTNIDVLSNDVTAIVNACI
jgi:hypothetical protein